MKHIGRLTAGGDCPGLNAAIRGIGKGATFTNNIQVIGYQDGFRGLMENRTIRLKEDTLSGILSQGGTLLGTSRDKPHRMPVGGQSMDMTTVMRENYDRYHLDALICIGGGGTQKNAFRLVEKGMNIITLPKTIDNDVAMTDVTLGFNTAMEIATRAIDRLHSTAHSHHRIIVVEIMGHNTGWLALGSGIASGADVILIPEIPYDTHRIAEAIQHRLHRGKKFSIVAVAEGAVSTKEHAAMLKLKAEKKKAREENDVDLKKTVKDKQIKLAAQRKSHTLHLARQLEQLTGLETRLTILGHLQRGGTPSSADRLLATRLGTACISYLKDRTFGVMIGVRCEGTEPVPLAEVVGKRKMVPLNHPWVACARHVGTCLGD